MADDFFSQSENFACAPGLKLEAFERLAALQFSQIANEINRIEVAMDQLERRLWLTVFGVVGVILSQAVQSILQVVP
jgi:uncharacterized protein Yka (UPF0111/DUF47 family)